MKTADAYNKWAKTYDTNLNKTRDLEAQALKETLQGVKLGTCLEIGCGTGKNTRWLIDRAQKITAIDFSEKMLSEARKKIKSDKVQFQLADVTQQWLFAREPYDLVAFSLVLEHVENLDFVFSQAAQFVKTGGYCYVGELHPFKQYLGTKARFETATGIQELTCYTHHISDFMNAAKNNGFETAGLREYFHPDDPPSLPRILSILFTKTG